MEIIKNYTSKFEEQETIINYDYQAKRTHIYTDVPKHARKYERFIDESLPIRKGYSPSGQLSMIDGTLTDDSNFNIRRKPKLTDAQRQRLSERAKSNLRKPSEASADD